MRQFSTDLDSSKSADRALLALTCKYRKFCPNAGLIWYLVCIAFIAQCSVYWYAECQIDCLYAVWNVAIGKRQVVFAVLVSILISCYKFCYSQGAS